MFNDVIVGVDGEDGGRDAIALAEALRARDGQLTLAYVYPGDAYVYRSASPAYSAAQENSARELLQRVRSEAKVDANLHWRVSSSPGRGLHELCEAVGADLLVVGSSRRGLLGRVLMGNDARAALNGAPCAIAIAPAGYSKEPALMREIGVGFDGSPESLHAVGVARDLAAEAGAKLSAFKAVSMPTYSFMAGPAPVDDVPEALVEDARQGIAELGDVEPHAAYGRPVEELALYSASLDLLVVGSRGYGPIGRLIHGSTSLRLAQAARCPLLVLTRNARTPSAAQRPGEGRELAGTRDA
jgi:nucleotide-binding universal stress UspA family protein